MNASDYFPFYIMIMSAFAFIFSTQYVNSNNDTLYYRGANNAFLAALVCIVLIFWMGMRPISSTFGDTVNYSRMYERLGDSTVKVDWGNEWVWTWLMTTSHSLGLSISTFFTLIEFLYISSVFGAIYILTPRNPLMGMLFVFVSFSFFTFGVNGLRNGLAVHLLIYAFALYLDDRYTWAIILFIISFGIHKSIVLPLACFLTSIYVIKDPKFAIYIWIASVPISLYSGYFFVNLFAGLGFDDRMEQYMSVGEGHVLATSTSAFRWDFLLYSSMPMIMAWVVIIKRKITDNWYNVLASTYCLSNAFWVLVIRASFTNRFAYLSWFLYPVIIVYPLIMLPVWEDQDGKTGIILIAYTILTLGICYFTGMIRL